MEREPNRSVAGAHAAVSQSPAVRTIDALLAEAARCGASDVHFEPGADALRVRIRVDGVLRELRRLPGSMAPAIGSRLKVMARLDIAERRLPQDGRIDLRDDRGDWIEARVSALPTLYGEKLVLRLVRSGDDAVGLDALGLDAGQVRMTRRALGFGSGMILISGPTGSGKTTSLYALLRELNDVTRNIVTVEDPVERRLAGINQVQVNEEIGRTFPTTLRALLRQDPDVIMIGEIRDQVTAEIAFRAALTGHLVLSTLHTEDAASSVTRLVDMGIAPFLVAAALRLVVAQRLVRTVCSACAVTSDGPCSGCGGSGLSGRVGLFEVMELTETLRTLVSEGGGAEPLRAAAVAAGMNTLAARCAQMVAAGRTTEAETWRVAGVASDAFGG